MLPVISIGNQDFESIRENHYFYMDKTDFIREWWESGDTVTLITRPRRFGKTLNMSMLECFFSNQKEELAEIFEGLSIWENVKYHGLQGSYPVIALSFADIKGRSFESARMGIIRKLVKLYSDFSFLRESDVLTEKEQSYFDAVDIEMSDDAAAVALNYLSDYLYRYYGKKALIFLDEYDTPLQEAYVNGYWKELTEFTRGLFNSTFKTNPYMERALMTGITRVSKESIFSDLNNLVVVTTTTESYQTSFGFTEAEVFDALDRYGMSDQKEQVKQWYDGFVFGKERGIYNPWSVTNFLNYGRHKTYWANTSSNRLAGKLIQEGSPDIKMAMEDLLAGETVTVALDEEVVFEQLDQNDEAVWSMLLASGYLKAEEVIHGDDETDTVYRLSLTNLEVQKEFRRMIRRWFSNSATRYNDFIKALLEDDIDYMNQYMNQVALQTFSYFDTAKARESDPERFYHGFVLGLIVDLADRYVITSNRESGFGRYDVILEPKSLTEDAIIVEFKVFHAQKEQSLEDTVQTALAQIKEKAYDAELLARGFQQTQIRHYGFAFRGKEVLIKREET